MVVTMSLPQSNVSCDSHFHQHVYRATIGKLCGCEVEKNSLHKQDLSSLDFGFFRKELVWSSADGNTCSESVLMGILLLTDHMNDQLFVSAEHEQPIPAHIKDKEQHSQFTSFSSFILLIFIFLVVF